jgi:ParB family transcriptional regulator, chromosome partitioning protein
MKEDLRKQAVLNALIKDNATDWKNIANKEIEENKKLKDKIDDLIQDLSNQENLIIIDLEPRKCRNWKYADRNKFELGNIEELAEDIKLNGQLQPVIVRKVESLDYDYEVIAGERRWRACSFANIPLKAIVTKEDDAGCMVIQTSENKKKSLSPYSLALSYQKIMNDLQISQNDLARKLNIPRGSFSELMAFGRVPKKVWDAVDDMSKVKPKTAAFLAALCEKNEEYLSILLNLSEKIREGLGVDSLQKLIDKHFYNVKSTRNFSRSYEDSNGKTLFRITSEGRISLSKSVSKNIDLDKFSQYLCNYFLENH